MQWRKKYKLCFGVVKYKYKIALNIFKILKYTVANKCRHDMQMQIQSVHAETFKHVQRCVAFGNCKLLDVNLITYKLYFVNQNCYLCELLFANKQAFLVNVIQLRQNNKVYKCYIQIMLYREKNKKRKGIVKHKKYCTQFLLHSGDNRPYELSIAWSKQVILCLAVIVFNALYRQTDSKSSKTM